MKIKATTAKQTYQVQHIGRWRSDCPEISELCVLKYNDLSLNYNETANGRKIIVPCKVWMKNELNDVSSEISSEIFDDDSVMNEKSVTAATAFKI